MDTEDKGMLNVLGDKLGLSGSPCYSEQHATLKKMYELLVLEFSHTVYIITDNSNSGEQPGGRTTVLNDSLFAEHHRTQLL